MYTRQPRMSPTHRIATCDLLSALSFDWATGCGVGHDKQDINDLIYCSHTQYSQCVPVCGHKLQTGYINIKC